MPQKYNFFSICTKYLVKYLYIFIIKKLRMLSNYLVLSVGEFGETFY